MENLSPSMNAACSTNIRNAAEICIVGAGSSGIAVAKALAERELMFDCLEKGSDIGGMWRYDNDSDLSSAYASLHIDTSRRNLGYSDFRIPTHLPDFLSHQQVLAYLEAYANHFGLTKKVTFNALVEKIWKSDDGEWHVQLRRGETRHYKKIIVANGHHSDPRWPSFPGRFDGTAIHSSSYRTAAPFEGKDVLVVGLGNSAVDIAVDLCRRAGSVSISTRRSAWIMPKYLMGVPVDRWSAFLARRFRLPTRVIRIIMARLIRLAVGDQRRLGLKRPGHPMWREHATLSQELLPYIGHGWITIKPNIASLDGDGVLFENGVRERFDAIIYATGYKPTFAFLDPQLFCVRARPVPLYRRIVSIEHPGLFFAGLVQPIGPTIPLVEVQARWIAAVLSGELRLPEPAVMWAEVKAHHARQQRNYLDSERYILEVDYRNYSQALRRDMRRRGGGI
jgi:dimethylaniline monooxygenase (N-oxide forming)